VPTYASFCWLYHADDAHFQIIDAADLNLHGATDKPPSRRYRQASQIQRRTNLHLSDPDKQAKLNADELGWSNNWLFIFSLLILVLLSLLLVLTNGYSLRSEVMDFGNYGVPQTRKCLIAIA
jgi:hypothetical protein